MKRLITLTLALSFAIQVSAFAGNLVSKEEIKITKNNSVELYPYGGSGTGFYIESHSKKQLELSIGCNNTGGDHGMIKEGANEKIIWINPGTQAKIRGKIYFCRDGTI